MGANPDCPAPVPDAETWAAEQWGAVDLGDRRRNARAVQIGKAMVAKPDASLPNQMTTWNAVRGAYRMLNNPAVTMEALVAPHCRATLAAAAQTPVVVLAEDTTELNYTAHPTMTGLGPVGDGRGRGLLLHETLAIVPATRHILGLAHLQVVLRQPSTSAHNATSPEGRLWQASAMAVGSPPAGVCWVHVSDRGSDDFAYMAACLDSGKHVLLRACQNRLLSWAPDEPQAQQPAAQHLLDYARSLPAAPGHGYAVSVRATAEHPARTAQVVLAWAAVTLPPPLDSPGGLANHAPLALWVLRVWEPAAPAGVEALDWILLTSLPTMTTADVERAADWWYPCRWICEDFHQCLKTGLRIERSQLDDGADVRRLLGFCAPVAVRLLQLRHEAREAPDLPATAAVDPLMVQILAARQHLEVQTLTLAAFWNQVARLGGYLGRRGDGPPGWRTVWRGWRYLCDLTEGAHLALTYDSS